MFVIYETRFELVVDNFYTAMPTPTWRWSKGTKSYIIPVCVQDEINSLKEESKQYETIKKNMEENKEFIDSKDDIYC